MLDGTSRYLSTPNLILKKKAGKEINCRLPAIQHRSIAQQFGLIKNLCRSVRSSDLNWLFSIFLFTIHASMLLSRPL